MVALEFPLDSALGTDNWSSWWFDHSALTFPRTFITHMTRRTVRGLRRGWMGLLGDIFNAHNAFILRVAIITEDVRCWGRPCGPFNRQDFHWSSGFLWCDLLLAAPCLGTGNLDIIQCIKAAQRFHAQRLFFLVDAVWGGWAKTLGSDVRKLFLLSKFSPAETAEQAAAWGPLETPMTLAWSRFWWWFRFGRTATWRTMMEVWEILLYCTHLMILMA